MTTYRLPACSFLPSSLAPAGLLLAVSLTSGCVIPMPVGNGAEDDNSGDAGATDDSGVTDDPGATSADDASSETDGSAQFPDCPAQTAADTSLAVAIDGAVLDPFSPPFPLLYVPEAACTVSGGVGSSVSIDCPDIEGQAHAFELTVESTPAVLLPAVGTAVSLMFHYEQDELSTALMNWAVTLREGSADGALLLALNGGSYLGIPGLDDAIGSSELCPEQEVDEAQCMALRRTTVAMTADGVTLESFDHGSVDAGGLRMVVGDCAIRTSTEDFDIDECPIGDGGLPGRFELVIGPPA